MLIGFFLLVCGCLLYGFIKPPLKNRKVKIASANDRVFGDFVEYTSLKNSRSLLLPNGIEQAPLSNFDREAKQNA